MLNPLPHVDTFKVNTFREDFILSVYLECFLMFCMESSHGNQLLVCSFSGSTGHFLKYYYPHSVFRYCGNEAILGEIVYHIVILKFHNQVLPDS